MEGIAEEAAVAEALYLNRDGVAEDWASARLEGRMLTVAESQARERDSRGRARRQRR